MNRSWRMVLNGIWVVFVVAAAASAYGQATPPDDDKQPAAVRPAAQKFPDGEKALKVAAADWVANFPKKPLPTVLKTYLIAPDWGMVRSPSGLITGRTAQTVIFVRGGETGRCTKRLCNLRQEEQGGKWGKPFLECVEQYSQRVKCSSVAALAP
jgi:hypothetical protein